MTSKPDHVDLPPIQSLWDYDNPGATEQRLRSVLAKELCSEDSEYRAEVMTQIARTHSLRGRFEQAHALLDEIDSALPPAGMLRARIRLLLERGRTVNSSGDAANAKPLFVQAWALAQANKIDGLAVDAAHMIANVSATADAIDWNERALSLAQESTDPDARRWIGSLCNNLGWSYHDCGQFETALQCFLWALDAREEDGDAGAMRIAWWCVARCMRSLGRVNEALAMQVQLERQLGDAGETDRFVIEEMAECLKSLGRDAEAQVYVDRVKQSQK